MGLMQASGLTLSPPLGVLHPNARGSIGLAVVLPGRGEQVGAGGGADKPGASRIELEVMLVDRTGELIAAEASHFFV